MQQQQRSNTHPIINPTTNSHRKYYFTQLALISTILQSQLKTLLQSFRNVDVSEINLSEEQDVCRLVVKCSCVVLSNEQLQKEQDKGEAQKSNFIMLHVYITVLQMQTTIKFHVKYIKDQYYALPISKQKQQEHINQQQTVAHNQHTSIADMNSHPKQSYSYIDEFWINYTNYLPKKIYQTYHEEDLHAKTNVQKYNKLLFIFEERIAKQIVIQAGYYGNNNSNNGRDRSNKDNTDKIMEYQQGKRQNSMKIKDLLVTALANNYDRINKYLGAKYYKNLSICNRQIYRVVHTQKNYKVIFQGKWGRTGFELEQQNWIKMYKNKILEQERVNRSKPVMRRGFFYQFND